MPRAKPADAVLGGKVVAHMFAHATSIAGRAQAGTYEFKVDSKRQVNFGHDTLKVIR